MKLQKIGPSFRFAFVKALPVLFSYLFLSIAFGMMMEQAGFSWLWSGFSSVVIYSGAYQYAMVPFLAAGASLATVTLTALFMSSRHIFYGLSFVEKFRRMGKYYPFMIFSLTDETYSLYCTLICPEGVHEPTVMFFMGLLNWLYWILGSVIGGLLGRAIPMELEGIDFCMTALFVTIFVDQWKGAKSRMPALLGLGVSAVCLLALGADAFLLPALMITVGLLLLFRKPLERKEAEA